MLLQALCLSLGKAFLDGAGSVVNQFLGFLQAKTGEFLDELNDCELACAGSLQDYVEVGLLFLGCAASCGSSSRSWPT